MMKSPAPPHILVVDDEENIVRLFKRYIEKMGWDCTATTVPSRVPGLLEHFAYDAVLSDLTMPGMDGLVLLKTVRKNDARTPFVIITGQGSIENTVTAMKAGASDYLVKPVGFDKLKDTLERMVPGSNGNGQTPLPGIIGSGQAMRDVGQKIRKAAKTDLTVLIQGENGTGKEVAARAVHRPSSRASESFVTVDCTVLSANIVESELFGHKKGAFTGADTDHEGLLKAAGNGTVFFDEISEIPPATQAKLLRCIQEREFRPVGATAPESFSARIVAATNRDLAAAVKDGRFREDLFYRIHVLLINLPPLRERKEDLPQLVSHFLSDHKNGGGKAPAVGPAAEKILSLHDWPGNIRELENCLASAAVMAESGTIGPDDLPASLRHGAMIDKEIDTEEDILSMAEYEKRIIRRALVKTGGDKDLAAKKLKIGLSTLYKKIKEYKI